MPRTPILPETATGPRQPSRRRARIAGLLLWIACLASPATSRAATQTMALAAQWNLISFQVIPDNPDPAAVFATLPGFQAAWSYDAGFGLWQRYLRPAPNAPQSSNDITANLLLALPPIEPGKAYWVFISQSVPSWQVQGLPPTGTSFNGLDLRPGWNLVGIPTGSAAITNTEPVSLLAILTAAGFDYDAILTWENQTYRKMFRPPPPAPGLPPNPLDGLASDAPFPSFDLQRDPGRGYWIRVVDPAIIRPRLVTTVRPDLDAEPLNNFPSSEDVNVSGSAQPRSVLDQEVIRFFPGEDVQTLGIANLGDALRSGGGLLLWEAAWSPVTDTATPEPWVRLFTSPGEREVRDPDGRLISQHSAISGVTTLENDTVYLRLDRRHLGRGRHEGILHLRSNVGERAFRVIAEVPGLEGDFEGHAVIDTVNGRRNPIPDVDLAVSFYEDLAVPGLLRGFIDSTQALLWPVDVPLVGYRVSDEANRFVLGGSFVLPPGDQNGEPFDRWDENDPTAGEDVDWLNDGVFDARNPFPFPIQRTVSLEGSLTAANPSDGHVLQGAYREIVHGLSRQPIELAGRFRLERKSARPMSTRRITNRDTGVDPVVDRSNPTPVTVPSGTTRDSAISVATELNVRSLRISLAFNPPLPHAEFRIQLTPPVEQGSPLTLYDGTRPGAAINPRLLESIEFPTDRPTVEPMDPFLRDLQGTRTDGSRGLFWKLTLHNAGGQAITLARWSLRLAGQPLADVAGVVNSDGIPVAGARVALEGLPFNLTTGTTDAQGRFTIHDLPLLPLNFSVSGPGISPTDPATPGLPRHSLLPFRSSPAATLSEREQRLIARSSPLTGSPFAAMNIPGFSAGSTNAPFELQVRQSKESHPRIVTGPLVIPLGATLDVAIANPAASAFWDFGDLSGDDAIQTRHQYDAPGLYHVRLFSPADSADPQDAIDIVVLPAPGHTPARPADLRGVPTGLDLRTASARYSTFVFEPFFTSAGVLPAHKIGTDPITGADRYLADTAPATTFGPGETNTLGAALVPALPIQMAAAASMDIDNAPHASPGAVSRPFASDGFTPIQVPGFDPAINVNNLGFKDEDFNYSHLAGLWQNTRTRDGTLEYPQDEQNGLIVWGNIQISPAANYSTQPANAADGTPFSYTQDDDVFHPHTGVTPAPDLANHRTLRHFQIYCSIGAPILPATHAPFSIRAAPASRSLPPDPLEPSLLPSPAPVSRNLTFQLQTGFLGSQAPSP